MHDVEENTVDFDADLIRRFDRPGPRYTSYPTADRFVEAYDGATHAGWLARREIGGISRPLSLYVHLPFCASLCYYCACNKIITKDHGRSAKYLHYLEKELDLVCAGLQGDRKVTQMHWGGGSPTFLAPDEMARLNAMLRSRFDFAADGEYAIEIDPRTVDAKAVAQLARLGFNRMSLGVQDHDPAVQQAIHRIQPARMTREVRQAARDNGFQSVNFDLIYGLPKQSVDSFARTLDEVIETAPDRIALYSYAHLPGRFKPQRRIADYTIPDADTKLKIFFHALKALTGAGYVYIGLDHFALPDDELAQAMRSARLHRNFQGYTTQPDCDLLSFGISAISKVGPTYSQNVHGLDEYYDSLDNGRLPVVRGIELTRDDLVRRAVIMALMCQGELALESIETAYLINFAEYFEAELAELEQFVDAGLLEMGDGWITITARGRFFLRGICMVFDRYLQGGKTGGRFSRLI